MGVFGSPDYEVLERTPTHVTISTGLCPLCGQPGTVTMPVEAFEKWDLGKGEFVQRAWPEGSAGDREMLINGTHDACFNKAFPDE